MEGGGPETKMVSQKTGDSFPQEMGVFQQLNLHIETHNCEDRLYLIEIQYYPVDFISKEVNVIKCISQLSQTTTF